VHIGRGNYNAKTAKIYEDMGLLTSAPQMGAEVTNLFNWLSGYSLKKTYRGIIVSPHETRQRMIDMIEREISVSRSENPGRIAMKMNNLVDEAVIDALYNASQNNVKIDLVVRGICALRPCSTGRASRMGPDGRSSCRSVGGRRWFRDEQHFEAPTGRVPRAAIDLATAYVRSASLSAVASLRTRRHRWILKDASGGELAEVVDDEVSVYDGRRAVGRFRELEVEDRSLGVEGLGDIAELLKEAGATSVDAVAAPAFAAPSQAPCEAAGSSAPITFLRYAPRTNGRRAPYPL
jgi:hypothetical protein